MTFLLPWMVLATAGPAGAASLDAFWARDLGALARAAPADPLGQDLYAFVTCTELTEQPQLDLPRLLLRLEQARWNRLRNDTAGTLFEDLARSDFFVRNATPFSGEKVLHWPAEEEKWAGEVPVIALPASGCVAPQTAADQRTLLEQALSRGGELPAALHARLRYEAAVLAFTNGDEPQARSHAEKLQLDALDAPLRFHAELLRTLCGVEGSRPLADLTAAAPAELAVQLSMHAGYAAANSGDWAAASKAVRASGSEQSTVTLYALIAADKQGNTESLKTALASLSWPEGTDRASAMLRSVAFDLSTRVMSGPELSALQRRWEGRAGAPSLEAIAYAVIARQRLDAAAQLVDVMASSARKKKASLLSLELSFLRSDAQFLPELTAFIDQAEQKYPGSGERAAKQLARRLALNASKNAAGWKAFTTLAQARFDLSGQRTWQEALSLAQVPAVTVVAAAVQLPEPPPLVIRWPKVHSLLLIPTPDGSWRSWFTEELADAR